MADLNERPTCTSPVCTRSYGPPDVTGGCWFAYYTDRSGCAPFGSEIEALRYAVEHSMQVRYVEYGSDPFTGEGR